MIRENTSSKGSFISQPESVMLQAFAVLLMVWHHLFGFPERVSVPYVLVFDSLAHMETLLSYFGRICISVFAFCSGYGMQKKAISITKIGAGGLLYHYREVIKRLVKFYKRYWAVFFIFVPLGFALGVYSFQPLQFVKGFLGMSSVYNAEWWYVGYYVRFLLLFPFLIVLADIAESKGPVLLHISMIVFVLVLTLMPETVAAYSFLSVLICFVEGMYFVRTDWFERIYGTLRHTWLRMMIGAALMAAVFALRAAGTADFLLVPFMVFGLMLLLKCQIIEKWAGSILRTVGKYSTYIWLTHTFFSYYYFQSITYLPKYSWLIAVWCVVLCVCSGIMIEQLLVMNNRFARRNREKVLNWIKY